MWQKIKCFFGIHEWVSMWDYEKPTIPENADTKIILDIFYQYTNLYCKHCGKPSQFNMRR